jgi:threonine dehydratase
LELLEEETTFEAVVVPIGGGGLISGIAVAMKSLQPDIRIIGVEPEHAASMRAALLAGQLTEITIEPTIADGLAVRRTGERTLEVVQHYVDEVVSVSEEEIASAILKLLEIEKTVVEGAGAASLAAVLFHKVAGLEGKNVAIIVGGGNIDPNLLSKIIERGLAKDGRLVRIRAVVRDRPGELAKICQIVADTGGNIMDVAHNRAFAKMEVGGVELDMILETRGHAHIEQLLTVFQSEGINAQEVS